MKTVNFRKSMSAIHIMFFQNFLISWKKAQGKLHPSSTSKWNYTYACAVKPYIFKVKNALLKSVYYLTDCNIYCSVHSFKTPCDLYHIVSKTISPNVISLKVKDEGIIIFRKNSHLSTVKLKKNHPLFLETEIHETIFYNVTIASNTTSSNHLYNTLELLMVGVMVPEICWASNNICNKETICCM